MTTEKKSERPTVELVRSIYQPSKKELEETINFGDLDLDPEDVAKMIMQPVNIRYVSRPKRETPDERIGQVRGKDDV